MKNFLQKADDLLYQVKEEKPGRNLYWKLSVNGTYIRKLHKIKCNGQKSAIDTFFTSLWNMSKILFGRLLYIEIRLGGAGLHRKGLHERET